MKKLTLKKALLSAAVFAAAVCTGATAGATGINDYGNKASAGGIGSSRHNLGSMGRVLVTTSTTEVCVFCHTPHHTNQSGPGGAPVAPLWNKGIYTGTYTAYGNTIGGTAIANGDIGSTTLACLSCHDGVTTWDNLVNAPGKGGVVAGGSEHGYGFRMPYSTSGTSTGNDNFAEWGTTTGCGCHGDEGGTKAGDTTAGSGPDSPFGRQQNVLRLNIGTDLSNDHPVSVVYNGAVAGLRPTSTVLSTIDLDADLAASATTAFNGNLAQNRWAVNGFITDSASISDLLRGNARNRVECSSCHDPHFRNLSWDEAEPTWADGALTHQNLSNAWCNSVGENCSDGMFLRRVGGNTGSGVCRTCHNK